MGSPHSMSSGRLILCHRLIDNYPTKASTKKLKKQSTKQVCFLQTLYLGLEDRVASDNCHVSIPWCRPDDAQSQYWQWLPWSLCGRYVSINVTLHGLCFITESALSAAHWASGLHISCPYWLGMVASILLTIKIRMDQSFPHQKAEAALPSAQDQELAHSAYLIWAVFGTDLNNHLLSSMAKPTSASCAMCDSPQFFS